MRKFNIKKILLLLVTSILLVNCGSDDDSIQITGDIAGIWNAVSVDYTGTTVTEASGVSITADYVGEGYDVDFTLTISEDPNVIEGEGEYSIELTTTVQGQTFTQFEEDLELLDDPGSWTMSGDTLTMIADGVATDFTITELTESSLIIEATEEEDFSQSGTSITTTINIVLVFTR